MKLRRKFNNLRRKLKFSYALATKSLRTRDKITPHSHQNQPQYIEQPPHLVIPTAHDEGGRLERILKVQRTLHCVSCHAASRYALPPSTFASHILTKEPCGVCRMAPILL